MPCGLEWGVAAQLIPQGVDGARVLNLLREFEGGLIEGAGETAKRQAEEAKRKSPG